MTDNYLKVRFTRRPTVYFRTAGRSRDLTDMEWIKLVNACNRGYMRVNLKKIALVVNVFGMPDESGFAVRIRQDVRGREHDTVLDSLDLDDVIILIDEVERVWEEEYVGIHEEWDDINPVA